MESTSSTSINHIRPIESVGSSKRKRKRTRKSKVISSTTIKTATCIDASLLHPNFVELSKQYPDFKLAWRNLKERRERKRNDSDGEIRQECFSTNVDFDFNLALSRALLHKHFHLTLPSMPRGHLCPPIPNRFLYVLWVRELVQQCHASNNNYFDEAKEHYGSTTKPLHRRGMDLGIGVSAIYPLLLSTKNFTDSVGKYGNNEHDKTWTFFGTDVDPYSIQCAQKNISANNLEDKINISLVPQSPSPSINHSNETKTDDSSCTDHSHTCGPILNAMRMARSTMGTDDGNISKSRTPHNLGEKKEDIKIAAPQDWVCFDFCMTNPPFYSTIEEGTALRCGDARSRTDMTLQEGVYPNGGEIGFIKDMICDSFYFRDCITWFTSMVGRKSSLLAIHAELKKFLEIGSIRTTEFVQGKTTRWGIAWTFRNVSKRSLATKVIGGLTSFEVEFSDSLSTQEAYLEVAQRISSFCETFKAAKLCSQTVENDTITIEDGTCAHNNHCLLESCLPEGMTDNDKRYFLVDIKLEEVGRIQTNESVKPTSNMTICVNLTLFAHSKRGLGIVRKIQSQIHGEVSRTNRKWRRKNTERLNE